ncbi:MAG: hypothetical protein H6818_04490 [Phycisphaerales bacterium]|nr:hypothetical protein [Phycisphaerales bacterium]MCB9864426.1 hypothetical protein [Phycisphaerales bacterium]
MTHPAWASITARQVLVVYNSTAAGSDEVLHAYISAHPDLPPENILDLNNAAISGADLTWTQFSTLVRAPIRDYLNAPGNPTPQGIISILLLRPFPHRILDTDAGFVCDDPNLIGNELVNGDATCASLDAELVLLWQNMEAGEAGGALDSLLDNMIVNPYHTSTTPISAFSRSRIQSQHSFVNLSGFAWGISTDTNRLTPGDMYLVCRIDANSTEEAVALVERSQRLIANKTTATILLDEFDVTAANELDDDGLFTSGDPFVAGDDYEETTAALTSAGWSVIYDDTFDFITGSELMLPLLGYASYGENHSFGGAGENPPGAGTYINDFTFDPGAVFNTIESFNGRALNGLGTSFGQEQVADFIGVGGTFAVGNVWEPFSAFVADNEFLLPRLLADAPASRFMWAEAAYASIPALSWSQIVIGDPLGRFDIVDDDVSLPGDLDDDGDIDDVDAGLFTLLLLDGYNSYRAQFPALDPYARADFSGDYQFEGDDLAGFVDAYLNQ